ncbi:MAG: tRNA uridine-5-carboxymethylaminomethyl(34) synthesis GTPase MnmE [Nitrospirota bacterium]
MEGPSRQADDTICAIATPQGEGGIGVLRISGEKAVEIAAGLVRLRSGKKLASIRSHTLSHADILDLSQTGGRSPGVVDEALVAVMRAPRSYTGEDVVEIHCHGGALVLQTVCDALLRLGARLAEPGEFTKRAFLNGRLDLTQAEAVLDTIRSRTAGSLRLAQAQLRGSLSDEINRLREALVPLLAQVEAAIDFTEEDIAFIQPQELADGLRQAGEAVTRLIESSKEGLVLREGVAAAIVGQPNVGKSSLLNALLQTDRAIVTPIPGTTRDVLEETVNIRGVPVRLLDTAGVRSTDDPVEQEGVKRSQAAMEQADLLVIVLDGSSPLTEADRQLLVRSREKKRLVAVNKSDLPARVSEAEIEAATSPVWISARTGAGLDDLRDAIRALVLRADFEPGESPVVTKVRHRASLIKAGDALANALRSTEARLSGEFVAVDLRAAVEALGEITGAVTTEEILDRIFREFCIGK